MAQEFKLPDLGEGTYEAEIQEILIEVGDEVDEGETIMTVETDKATMDVPSPHTGRIGAIHVERGEIARVGDLLVTFGNGAEEAAPEEEAEEEPPREARAEKDEQKETESAADEGDEEDEGKGRRAAAAEANGDRPVPAAPATRRLARELDVDLRAVEGSGPGGRVTRQDVRDAGRRDKEEEEVAREAERAEAAEKREAPERAEAPGRRPALPDFSRWGDVEQAPLRSVRRTTARRMAQSWSQIPHVTHHDAADITELNTLIKEEDELDLTITLFAMKAAVAALRQFPRFNASLDMEEETLILKKYYHIGAAVDTDRGLIVPVIRDVDRKSIAMLGDEFGELVQRTRDGEVALEELRGGTFTITNVGPLGGTHFTPIINYPQVAILGLARAEWRPVVRDTHKEPAEMSVEPRLMLPLVLGFDHRVVDGADAARFMNVVVDTLENPRQLLLRA